jgi:hypothetical protein
LPRASFAPILAAALLAIVSVALCVRAIVPFEHGLLLFTITGWFSVPGVLAAWLMYAPGPGRSFAAWIVGPIWGYGLSSLMLLVLWMAGVRSGWFLVAPIGALAVAGAAGMLLKSVLAPPAFRRADLIAVLLLLVMVPAIVGRPFAHVAEPVAGGRAYRAYFTADMIWRMAVVAEVTKGAIPPRNPFLRGEALHYYWLPHLLAAAEYRMVGRSVSLEQVLLVNSVGLGLAFVLFLYGFVRHWVHSAGAAAAAVCAALVMTSFEGAERLWVLWRSGAPPATWMSALEDLNIDAVSRWFYGSLPVDGFQRLLWYQPHHSTGYALGLSALLLLAQVRRLTPGMLCFCGSLLGLTLLFSTFAAIMLTLMVAVAALAMLVRAREWRTLAFGSVAGAVPLALSVGIAHSLRYVDTSGPSIAQITVNPLATTNVGTALFLSFGPMGLAGIVGAIIAVRRRAAQFTGIAAIVLVSLFFYFFVDVVDHQSVYVGWRAGHFLFVALAVLTGYALQECWNAGRATRSAAAMVATVLAILSLPMFAIDFYNTQDITNHDPNDNYSWTLIQSPGEVAALAWIRTMTRPDAVVQIEPHVREGRRWADIPAFAERRMSAGLPISMVPLARYEAASANVRALFEEQNGEAAFRKAAQLGADYVMVGPPERKAFPLFEQTLQSHPSRFREVFRSGDVSIFMLEGGS